ncbi:MAG: lipopolysaccharide core heptose(I) kinase RfaP [Lentisphaeria bacterium]|nr:lipopolysaccharide core heptose(I) kinase RfaP [Lentisphaeria bacterium]
MAVVDLRPPFAEWWRHRDPFAEAFALEGEEFRNVKNRRTFRIEAEGRGFFVKLHRGVGWAEIFKNLFQFKLPVTDAGSEYRALTALKRLGVPTMEIAAFGCRNFNPARRESFLITEELTDVTSLEDLARRGIPGAWKPKLIRALARSAGTMHRAGINHRDCYLCHYLLKNASLGAPEAQLHVIDLHRAQMRRRVPYRYRVKDVAGLCFSALDLPLSRRDLWRFIAAYSGRPLRTELKERGRFWSDVYRTALKLYRKEFNHAPARAPLAGIC